MSHANASRHSYARPGNDPAAAREPPPSMREGISASSCALRDKQQWSGVPAAVPRRRAGTGVLAVPGSNGRPLACKARANAAVYRRLSLIPLGERWAAHSCCALLRFAASMALPCECRRATPRFHDASTTSLGACRVTAGIADVPLGKRTRDDGRCPARTGDLLLVRREHLLRSAAVCPITRSASDVPPISAALCCGLPLPRRFHKRAAAFTRKRKRGGSRRSACPRRRT